MTERTIDVLAVLDRAITWDDEQAKELDEAVALVAELLEKGRRIAETQAAYRRAGSGKYRDRFGAYCKAVDEFCAALSRVKG